MGNIQLVTDCEGPLALYDNAFELCREFIKPGGDRFFTQVSRFEGYLADIAKKVALTEENLRKYDCVLISTAHSDYDYQFIADHAPLIIDTRNAMRGIALNGKLAKA